MASSSSRKKAKHKAAAKAKKAAKKTKKAKKLKKHQASPKKKPPKKAEARSAPASSKAPAAAVKEKAPAAKPSTKGAAAVLPLSPQRGPKAPSGSPRPPKKGKRAPMAPRRGPNGEILAPGELLLPAGPRTSDEITYLLRGWVASERPSGDAALDEVVAKGGTPEARPLREDVIRLAEACAKRFEQGAIEPLLPSRPQAMRRSFASVVERAKGRRREIGAFLRGLDLGRTEVSHMDSHGEDSLQRLMEWAARLENLAESDEPDGTDYGQFHRVLDQLESNTEGLVVDVELTLRRLKDRHRAK
jgi:hypothetical protein